jgi:alpha-beta hydrolase superfamily lysophospholipase
MLEYPARPPSSSARIQGSTPYTRPVSVGPDPASLSSFHPDHVLGAGYLACEIDLGRDREGPLLAVLVHRVPPSRPGRPVPPVLVLHGWSDYVFQRDLLEHLAARGHDIWSLDLRRHGRALRPWQTPTLVRDLGEVDQELDAALATIGRGRPPIVLAHSLGGLLAVRRAAHDPDAVAALVLNTPWLESHGGPAVRRMLTDPVTAAARRWPQAVLPVGLPGSYGRALQRNGRTGHDLTLKPLGGHRIPIGTLAAVLRAQGDPGLRVPATVPTLVLRSRGSMPLRADGLGGHAGDLVLDVHAVARAAGRIAPHAHQVVLDGAVHDVFLSAEPVRRRALGALDQFLASVAPPVGCEDA